MAFVQANDVWEEKRRERQRALMSTGLENIAKGYAAYEKAEVEKAKLAAENEREKRKAVREDMNFVVTMNDKMGTDIDPFKGAEYLDPERAQENRRSALRGEQADKEEAFEGEYKKARGERGRADFLAQEDEQVGAPLLGGAPDSQFKARANAQQVANENLEREEEIQADDISRGRGNIEDHYAPKFKGVPKEPDYEGLQGLFAQARASGDPRGGEKYLKRRNLEETLKKKERENDPAFREEERQRKLADSMKRIEAYERARIGAESRGEQIRIDGEIRREKDKIEEDARKEKEKIAEEGRKVVRTKEEEIAKYDSNLRDINEIRKKLKAVGKIGPFKEEAENLKAIFKKKDPKWIDFVSSVSRTITPILHEYAGTAQSPSEKKGILGFLPDVKDDSAEGILIKLKGFEEYIKNKKTSSFGFIIKNRSEEENKRRLDEFNRKKKRNQGTR
jgi:hypothetical protein